MIKMRRKQKKAILAVGILIAVILIILIANGNLKILTLFGQGMTIKSMVSTSVISEDTDLSGVWFLISAYSGGGQSIAGTLEPGDAKALSNYQTKFPLTMTASALDEKMKYTIKNAGTQVYSYSDTVVKSSCGCTSSCWTHPEAPPCPSGTTEQPFLAPAGLFGLGKYTCERHCFKKTQVGVLGNIESSSVKDSLTMTLSIPGESITETIVSGGNADFVSKIKGLIATVQYPASGWTGNFPQDSSPFQAYYDLYKISWSLTSDAKYVIYQSALSSFESWVNSLNTITYSGNVVEQYNSARADISNRLGTFQSAVSSIRSDDLSLSQSQSWGNRANGDNSEIFIDLDRQLAVADLLIKVRADWLGVVINVGKPQILSTTCNEFKAGDMGKIIIQVKNIGTASGMFVPSISCGIIQSTFNINAVPIDAGQVGTIEIPIDAVKSVGGQTDNCKIRVQEYNKASNYDETSVSCKIVKPALCQEGSVDITENCIRKCENGIPKQLKCCTQGESLLRDNSKINDEFLGYYCYSSNVGGGEGELQTCQSCDDFAISKMIGMIFKSKQCKASFLQGMLTCSLSFLKYILAILVLIIGTLIGKDLFAGLKSIRKYEWLQWILALITAGLIAYLVFAIFWLGVAVFVVWLIFRMLIGGKIKSVVGAVKGLR